MSFLKKNGKLILGALFILLALTPILFSPLVEIIVALINGMELSVKSILNLWTNKSIFSWLIVAVYLVIGINFILQRFAPSVKLPQWFYIVVFGVLALFGLISFISNAINLAKYIQRGYFESWEKTDQARWILSVVAGFMNFLGHTAVALALLLTVVLKKRNIIFAFIPVGCYALGAILNVVTYMIHIAYLYEMMANYDVYPYIPPSYVVNILYSLVYAVAMALFCYLFIASAEENTEASVKQPTAVKGAEMTSENRVDELLAGLEADVKAEAAQSAKETGSAPKLTPLQVEQLQKLKEAYDVGVISEVELAAKRSKILGDND